MDASIHDALAHWGNFYMIAGTAAAALTGLQFVVQTLISSGAYLSMAGVDPEGGIAAFGTPTVVHFALALVVSALLSAPWPGYGSLGAALSVLGTGALVYSFVVLRRARRQRGYVPTAYDWFWHFVVPAAAYLAVVLSGVVVGRGGVVPFFIIGTATMLLLCVGIHNSWDTITYLTVTALRAANPPVVEAAPPATDSPELPAP